MKPLADQIVQALEQERREPYYIVGFLQAILRHIEQGHPAKETLEFHLNATLAEADKQASIDSERRRIEAEDPS
jgi:hypothetical protein